ncbi:MAG: adenylyltransferase/cytidyltransferase family protein [Clostridia bacterium]|nr:adenylyltransferase/cytidyltransferase family protein [Clostridia bacterium]
MKKIGLTIGKYAPFHKGHELLIQTALKEMDELYILIYETDLINIPIEKRAEWIKQIYPETKIYYAENPPKQIGMDNESIKIQIDYIKEKTKEIGNPKITHFYSSETYGEYVAKELNIQNRIVDLERKKVPIKASTIRKNPIENEKYLNQIVFKEIEK